MKLGDVIEDGRIKIQSAIERMNQASHEAGYITGLDTAIACAADLQSKAQSVQGKAACEAVMTRLRTLRDEMIANGGAVR